MSTPTKSERLAAIAAAMQRGSKLPRKPAAKKLPRRIPAGAIPPPERKEQIDLAVWLERHVGAYGWLHVPNEGKRSSRYGASLKAQGLKPGFPDVVVFEPCPDYLGVVIELKRQQGPGWARVYNKTGATAGGISPEQREWLRYFARRRYKSFVAYGAHSAISVLASLGYGPETGDGVGCVEMFS